MTFPKFPGMFQNVTRKRAGAGTYTAGRWVGAVPEADVTIVASVQPAGDRDLLRLPEGLRTRKAVMVYTDGDIRTANETAKVMADRIVYQGEEWEIVMIDPFTMPLMAHKEAMAVRVDRAGAAIP